MPIKLSPKFSVDRAHATQMRLSKRVIQEDTLPSPLRYVGGMDVAYAKGISIGAAVVLNFSSLSLVESKTSHVETRFPYVPTLLSFREIPPAFAAISKLNLLPDVFLVDGHGLAHPYRFGFAAHLGVTIDVPTIGVAKNRLSGETELPRKEAWTHLVDKGDTIGAVVTTKEGSKPMYVSVGHKVSLERAVKVVAQCTRDYRIPEPIRKAHIIATEGRRELGS